MVSPFLILSYSLYHGPSRRTKSMKHTLRNYHMIISPIINIQWLSGWFSISGIALISERRLKALVWPATSTYLYFPVNGSSNSNCSAILIRKNKVFTPFTLYKFRFAFLDFTIIYASIMTSTQKTTLPKVIFIKAIF